MHHLRKPPMNLLHVARVVVEQWRPFVEARNEIKLVLHQGLTWQCGSNMRGHLCEALFLDMGNTD